MLLALAWSPRAGQAQCVTLELSTGPRPRVPPRTAGAALALNGMGEVRLAALAEALGRLEQSVARRKNPLYVPLDDDLEGADRKIILDSSGPLAAARALSAGLWRSAEADLAIEAVARCRRAERCVRLGANERLPPRHRFLAWPLGYALVVTADSTSGAETLAARLRDGAGPDARIGLVLAGGDLHRLRRSPVVDRLVQQARRLAKAAAGSPLAEALGPLAAAGRAGDELPWLHLPPTSILVIPRLGALAHAEAFFADVKAVAPGATWLSPP